MNDLDDRLQQEFADLTASTPLDLGLSTDDLIQAGRRVRRARSARRTVGAAAVAVTAAVLAWSGLPSPGSAVRPVVPAAPAPSSGALTQSAYFRLTDLGLSRNLEKIRVDAEPVGSGWDVTITTSRSDGLMGFRHEFQKDAMPGAVTIAPRVVVEFLPTRADWWNVAMSESPSQLVHSDSMHVGALDLTAIVVVLDESARADDIAGFVWAEPDGVIRDSLGHQVLRTEVTVGERVVTLYWDESLDIVGYQSPNGYSGSAGFKLSRGIYPRSLGVADHGGGVTADLLGDVLPDGAHDLRIALNSGRAEWGSAELAGRIVYVVAQPSGTASRAIRSISYLGADGQPVALDMP